MEVITFDFITPLGYKKKIIPFVARPPHPGSEKLQIARKCLKDQSGRLSFQYHLTKISSARCPQSSVVEVFHGKIPRGQEELCNTLYDLRMGTIEKGAKCETCSMDYIKCKGHFVTLCLPCLLSVPFAQNNSNG